MKSHEKEKQDDKKRKKEHTIEVGYINPIATIHSHKTEILSRICITSITHEKKNLHD